MRVNTLRLKNFLAHADTTVDLGAVPIAVFVGANEAGKSSLVDGVRWALLNRARGLTSGQNRSLVRRGAESCKVELGIRHGDADLAVARTPSGGSPSQEAIRAALRIPDDQALEAALDAGRFLDLTPKERRAMAFRLAGAEVTADLLRTHGIDDEAIVTAALTKGFEVAERRATEAKRAASRALEEVQAPAPVDEDVAVGTKTLRVSSVTLAQAQAALATIRRQRDEARAQLSAAESEHRRAATDAEALTKARADLKAIEESLAALEKRTADAAKGRPDPKALRERAAQLEGAAHEPAPQAPAAPSLEPVPDTSGVAERVRLRRQEAERAASNPWRKVEIVASRLGSLGAPAAPFVDELLVLARANGGDAAALSSAVAAAEQELQVAEQRAAEVRQRNDDAQRAHAGATDQWRQRRADRDARVAKAAQERQDLLADASRLEAVIAADTRVLEAERTRAAANRARVSGIEQTIEAADELPDLDAFRKEVETLDARLIAGEAFTAKVRAYGEAKERHEAASSRREALTAEAARYERMEKALRPDGVMAALVAGPLGKLRAVIDQVAPILLTKSLRVTDEWEIAYDDAPVSLASTSARWRIGAALAIALGALSGLRWVVLDEASVCVGEARDRLTHALVAAREHFDQVVVVGSRSDAEMAALRGPSHEAAQLVGIWRVSAGRVERVPAQLKPEAEAHAAA